MLVIRRKCEHMLIAVLNYVPNRRPITAAHISKLLYTLKRQITKDPFEEFHSDSRAISSAL